MHHPPDHNHNNLHFQDDEDDDDDLDDVDVLLPNARSDAGGAKC